MSDAPAGAIARAASGTVPASAAGDPVEGREPGRPATAVLGPPAPPTSAERLRNAYRTMPDSARSALWRQRLHEAESGLTRLLASRPGTTDLADWFTLQAEIFADLPDPATAGAADWQRVFFRGQALMERFLITRYGEQALTAWARAIAQVHRDVEPDQGRGAADPVHRIARQAELYGSDYEFDDEQTADGTGDGTGHAALTITHCAIWDYREKARRSGVRLTLASPCTYCTKALSSNIAAKGFDASYDLRTGPTGHGCRWDVTAPPGARDAGSDDTPREQ